MATHIWVKKEDSTKDMLVKVADIRMVKVGTDGSVLLSMVDNGVRVVISTITPDDVIRNALGKSFIAIKDKKGCTILVRRSWVRKVVQTASGCTVYLPKTLNYVLHTNVSIEHIYGLLI